MIRNYSFFLDLSEAFNSLDLASQEISTEDQAIIKQITQVLRLKEDSPETISFFDNSSKIYKTKIQSLEGDKQIKKITFKIEANSQSQRELKREVKFFIPVIKIDKFEMMVQKLTELGVQTMIPVLFERSQGFNLEKLNNEKQKARLRKIIIEATEQCEGAKLAELKEPIKLSEISKELGDETKVYAFELLSENPKQFPKEITSHKVSLLVGPEGGITEEESELLKSLGFEASSLGSRLLKAETAAITLFSALRLFN